MRRRTRSTLLLGLRLSGNALHNKGVGIGNKAKSGVKPGGPCDLIARELNTDVVFALEIAHKVEGYLRLCEHPADHPLSFRNHTPEVDLVQVIQLAEVPVWDRGHFVDHVPGKLRYRFFRIRVLSQVVQQGRQVRLQGWH